MTAIPLSPWTYHRDRDGDYPIARPFDGAVVAVAKTEVIARMMTAAPALLNACRHVLISIDAIAENWPEQRGILSTLQEDVAELRAAIALAQEPTDPRRV